MRTTASLTAFSFGARVLPTAMCQAFIMGEILFADSNGNWGNWSVRFFRSLRKFLSAVARMPVFNSLLPENDTRTPTTLRTHLSSRHLSSAPLRDPVLPARTTPAQIAQQVP